MQDKGFDRWFRDPNTWKQITHCPGCGVELSAEVVTVIEQKECDHEWVLDVTGSMWFSGEPDDNIQTRLICRKCGEEKIETHIIEEAEAIPF